MKLSKTQKKLVSMLIVLSMVVSLFVIVPSAGASSAYNDEHWCVVDGYEYTYQILDDDTARVVYVSRDYGYYWDEDDYYDDYEDDYYEDDYYEDGDDKQVELFEFPSELDGHTVTEIDCELYYIEAKSIKIPNTVKVIDRAFRWCYFDTIYLPASLETVGPNTFYNSEIKHLEIDPDCKALNVVNGLLYTADSKDPLLFLGSSDSTITVPDGATRIAGGLFTGCEASKIILPDSVNSIGGYAFERCNNLTEIRIPDSVTDLSYTFPYCQQLKSVTLPAKLKSIGSVVFSHCTSLSDITLPSTLESIGNDAFSGCESLKSITIPGNVKKIGRYAFNNSGLESVTIGSGVKTIGYEAFYGCKNLKSVTIPGSVETIGDYAFGYYEDDNYVDNYDDYYEDEDYEDDYYEDDYYDDGYYEDSDYDDDYYEEDYWDYYREPAKVEGFTIYGVAGTAAQRYAEENGFKFVEVAAYILGDADGDTEVTILDATSIQRHLASLPTQSFNEKAADADQDGEVTIIDATTIQRHLAALPTQAKGIGQPIA